MTSICRSCVFFNFVKRLPRERRQHYCLVSKLRMRSPSGDCLWVCHRMFYVPDPFNNSLWLALCLYGPLSFDWPGGGHLVDTVTGAVVELGARGESKILSDREIQVLRLIDKGLISKQIADTLSISNPHREPASAGDSGQVAGAQLNRSVPRGQGPGAALTVWRVAAVCLPACGGNHRGAAQALGW